MQSYLQGCVHLLFLFHVQHLSCRLSSLFDGLYLRKSSRDKDHINALCFYVWLASIMERVSSNPVRTMQDLAVFRNREYSSLCPGARPFIFWCRDATKQQTTG